MKLVLKIGGAALENPATLQSCVRAIKSLVQDGHQLVVVHGGGSALTRTLKMLGKQSQFINGLRVTDAETRDVASDGVGGFHEQRTRRRSHAHRCQRDWIVGRRWSGISRAQAQ